MNDLPLKCMVFRIPASMKTDFRIALMKHNLDVQHTLEAFAEAVIAEDKALVTIFKRAKTLSIKEV